MAINAEIDCEFLITLIQNRSVLWDKLHESYKVRTQTRNAWVEIFKELNPWYEEMDDTNKDKYGTLVMKKWRNIMDAYNKSEKNIKHSLKSGKPPNKKYIYQEQLQFLKKNTDRPLNDDSVFQEWNIGEGSKSNDPLIFVPDDNKDFVVGGPSSLLADINDETEAEATEFEHSKTIGKRKAADTVERELISALRRKPDRHTSFFNGIIPSLELFDDDEVVEFQLKVLQIVSEIKKRKNDTRNIYEPSPQSHNYPYTIPNGIAKIEYTSD